MTKVSGPEPTGGLFLATRWCLRARCFSAVLSWLAFQEAMGERSCAPRAGDARRRARWPAGAAPTPCPHSMPRIDVAHRVIREAGGHQEMTGKRRAPATRWP